MSKIRLFFLSLIINFVASCPPLPLKKGVKLDCTLPQNSTISDCNSEVPKGTIATFSCDKYYIKKFPHEGKLVCTEDSLWEHSYDYEDFNCQVECGVSRMLTPIIVSGSQANKYDFPWHASIYLRNTTNDQYQLICGGSLIDLKDEGPLILTAAHCLGGLLEDYRVLLGMSSSKFLENKDEDSQFFGVSYYEVYPLFNETNLENDIAVMKLNGDIKLSDGVKPICLERGESEPKIEDIGIVAGFGKTEEGQIPNQLLYAALPARGRSECAKQVPKSSKFNFTTNKFCAGYLYQDNINRTQPGICFGDSGGGFAMFDPMKKRSMLLGIANAAFKDPRFTCSGLGYFQGVQSYIGWIREVQKVVYPDKNICIPSVYDKGVEILGKRCGSNPDWVEYKNEKCFRFVKQLATKVDALRICGFQFGEGNSLPVVRNEEEHGFLMNLLKSNRITNGVWLGSARGLHGFNWDNGDGMKFSKWSPNLNSNGKNCSIIQPRTGLWVEEDCEAENLIICEKLQVHSNAELLQRIVRVNDEQKASKDRILGLESELEEAKAKLNTTIEKLETILSYQEELVMIPGGGKFTGLRTGVWYTLSNKYYDGHNITNYMTWVSQDATNYGQMSRKSAADGSREVDMSKYKPGGDGQLDAQWMIRKTRREGAYTIYSRGLNGYLIAPDNYPRVVDEIGMKEELGFWCFNPDKDGYFKISFCKPKSNGGAGLYFWEKDTYEGYLLEIYTINQKDLLNCDLWKARLA